MLFISVYPNIFAISLCLSGNTQCQNTKWCKKKRERNQRRTKIPSIKMYLFFISFSWCYCPLSHCTWSRRKQEVLVHVFLWSWDECTKCWPSCLEESKSALKNNPEKMIKERKCWGKYIWSLAFMVLRDVESPAFKDKL